MDKKPYHHGDLKHVLIEAATVLIAQDGIEALSVRNVAKAAGVSHTALYRHYKNKEEIIVALAANGFMDLSADMETAADKFRGDPLAQLDAMGKTYIQFAVDHSLYYRLMFGDRIKNKTEYPELFTAYDNAFRNLLHIIKQCPSVKRNPKEQPEITALAAWSMLHGYASLVIDNKTDKDVGSKSQIHMLMNKLLTLVSK